MSKTVFLLGAGFNQFLKVHFDLFEENARKLGLNSSDILKFIEDNGGIIDQKSSKDEILFSLGSVRISPPMSNNFFKYAIIRQISLGKSWHGVTESVLEYIEKYFNRNVKDLLHWEFDLELLFTFIEFQIQDEQEKNNSDSNLKYLKTIRRNLIITIGEIFFELEWRLPSDNRELLIKFGEIINRTNSDIITFNYDCLVERGIEIQSGKNSNYNIGNGESYFNWSRILAYDVKFDKIRVNTNNYWRARGGKNEAKEFYNKHKNKQQSKLIKLHGSYNWYRYSEHKERKIELSPEGLEELFNKELYLEEYQSIPKNLQKEIMCFNGDWQFGVFPKWNSDTKYCVESIIVPPILFKEKEMKNEIFGKLWETAKNILSKCEEIIIIGYSFPGTDFYAKKMFIEAFSQNKDVNITIVDPNSENIKEKLKKLFYFKNNNIRQFNCSGEFIKNFESQNKEQYITEEQADEMLKPLILKYVDEIKEDKFEGYEKDEFFDKLKNQK